MDNEMLGRTDVQLDMCCSLKSKITFSTKSSYRLYNAGIAGLVILLVFVTTTSSIIP